MDGARTDTFAYDVPVALDFRSLVYGDSAMVVQPGVGRIYAYEVTAQAGDSLVWGANAPSGWTSMAKTGHGFTV